MSNSANSQIVLDKWHPYRKVVVPFVCSANVHSYVWTWHLNRVTIYQTMGKFRFISEWNARATLEEVAEILGDPMALSKWWPAVYLSVTPIENSNEYSLVTKGWLPYLLRWRLSVVENNLPVRLAIRGTGDLVGDGLWSIYAVGDMTHITFEWKVQAEQPIMRALSPIIGPVFAANHRWAMAQGEESLRLELMRRRAQRQGDTMQIPAPPRPTWPHGNSNLLQVS